MKITTQRTMLWTADFVFVAALIGLVLIIAQKKQSASKEHKRHIAELDDMLAREKKKQIENAGADTGSRTPTVQDRNFHYEGYVPPPPPPVEGPKKQPGAAPALETLIEVVFLMASSDVKGPSEGGGATITIKALPPGKNTFFYLEGEVIGVGDKMGDQDITARADSEPTLKRFGGAVLKRVLTDGIICEWGKADARNDVKVEIAAGDEPTGAMLKGPDGFEISAKSSGRKTASVKRGPLVIFGNLRPGRGGQDVVELTKEGFERLENGGSEVFDGITFGEGKNAEGGKALLISKIPRDLQGYGLQDGDVIVKIDSTPVTSKASVVNYVRGTYRKQSRYSVTVLRDGQQRILKVDVPRNFKDRENLRRKLGDGRIGVDPGRARNADRARKRDRRR